jgi:hypothetical protein
MSKSAKMKSKCICEKTITFAIGKPKFHTQAIAKATCECGSRYMFTAKRDARTTEIEITARAITISDKARKLAREKILERKNA